MHYTDPPSLSVLNSWKTCSASRCWCRTVPRPTEQGAEAAGPAAPGELLEEEWLGDEQTGSTPLLLSLAVNADSLALAATAAGALQRAFRLLFA